MSRPERLHFVGVGGVGMSGIARVLAASGVDVSGCDRSESPALDALRAEGVRCSVPHDPAHLDAVDRLVVSTAIDREQPELAEARRRGLPILHRSEALAEILAAHERRVVVTGAHGKTSTSAMIAYALERLGGDPTFLIGGEVPQLGTNARAGRSGTCVVEGDESDRSVARLPADIGVILNVDLDHLDHYASVEEVVELLGAWAAGLPEDGLLVLGDGVAIAVDRPTARFGCGPGEGLRALDIEAAGVGIAFRPSRGPERVRLGVPGAHNAGNACAAALVLERLGWTLEEAFTALAGFNGAGRRFQLVGERDGIRVYDDYAHHPTELRATIAAARGLHAGRLVVYFQPHMPWRTRAFAEDFAEALVQADLVVISDTYVARGRPVADASGERIVEGVLRRRPELETVWAPSYADALAALLERTRPGDLVLCCGAGPVDRVARDLAAGGAA